MPLRVHCIQRFCLHDGPGIRTTIFLQGCPLRCWWCHNPETQAERSEPMREWRTADLAAELRRDEPYWIESGGGVTLSGGEPLMQAEAAAELLVHLREADVHTAVDTCGDAPREEVRRLCEGVGLWLWDVKAVDDALCEQATGRPAARALANLSWLLSETDTAVVVRVPLIATFNDAPEVLAAIAAHVADLPRRVDVDLLPGHTHGASKAARPLPRDIAPSTGSIQRAVDIFLDAAVSVRCHGPGRIRCES